MLSTGLTHAYFEKFSPEVSGQTTPKLDFNRNYCILNEVVSRLYEIRTSIHSETALHSMNLGEALEKAARRCLQLLNRLTKNRPAKRSKPKTLQDEQDKDNEFETDKKIKIDLISTHSFDPTLSSSQKAQYYTLRGKILNVFDGFSEQAEYNLQKATKLDPNLIEAWIHLGESYYKKRDLNSAEYCFRWGMNKVSYFIILET